MQSDTLPSNEESKKAKTEALSVKNSSETEHKNMVVNKLSNEKQRSLEQTSQPGVAVKRF